MELSKLQKLKKTSEKVSYVSGNELSRPKLKKTLIFQDLQSQKNRNFLYLFYLLEELFKHKHENKKSFLYLPL